MFWFWRKKKASRHTCKRCKEKIPLGQELRFVGFETTFCRDCFPTEVKLRQVIASAENGLAKIQQMIDDAEKKLDSLPKL